MSVTIDSLDIQIKTSAGDSAVNIERLADALENLKNNSKLTTVVRNLEKLKKALDDLKGSTSAIVSLTKLAQALGGVGAGANTMSKAVSKLPKAVNNAASATNNVTTSNNKVGKSFDLSSMKVFAAIQNYQELISAIHAVRDALAMVLGQAMEWDGIQFRFGRAFGEDAEETYNWILKINDALGINIQQFMQYSSLYGSLLSGFGMAQEKVTTISVGLTELSYDIWAAYNDRFKTLEDASEAVRSAITGEIEPIRNAGIALTEASLQEYIDSTHLAGISIEKLTEAQKSEVRYAAMVNAALNQGIVGTYAREMNTAEGAVRSLSQSMKGLVQALGSLFIPLLQVVVPYVTAFVEILTDAMFAIGKFFGIKMQEIDWSNTNKGVGSLAEGAEDAASGLDSAKKAAKQLKDYTMGFDELNVISPDSGSSSGGSGGAGAGADGWGTGLDLEKLWDDSIFAQASSRVDEIKEKLKDVLKFVTVIGVGFAAWKLAKSFMAALDILKITLQTIGGSAGAKTALSLFGLDKTAKFAEKLGGILNKSAASSKILAAGSASGAASAGTVAAAIAVAVAGVASLVGGLVLVYKKSENFREGLSAIGQGLVWLFEKVGDLISWCGEKIAQFGDWLSTKINLPQGLLDFFDALGLGIGDVLIVLGSLLLGGPLVAGVVFGVVQAIKLVGYAAKDSLQPVELFGDGISEATKEKVEPFIEKMDELDNALKTLDWGNAIIDESDLASISEKLGAITDTIVSELDADQNEALAKLNPLREAMSDEKFNDLQKKIKESYSKQKKDVEAGEARILEIMQKASDEARALTDAEAAEIDAIQLQMKETGVKYLSESETESNLILQRLKDNAAQLSAEQASEVIKNAITARDETIDAAKKQYDGIALEAQRMLDTGVINKEEYDEIIKAAEGARDETIESANTQYDSILETAKTKMGEYSKYIDDETGEIKSNWEVFCDDTSKKWNESWSDIKTWWEEKMAPFFTKKYWSDKWDTLKQGASEKLEELKKKISDKWDDVKEWWNKYCAKYFTKQYWIDTFNTLKDGLITSIKNGLNGAIDLMNRFIGWVNKHLKFSWDGLSIAGKEIYPGGSVQLFTIPTIQKLATGGFIEDGLFTMNHGEIVGKFSNGKSVVANNQQIVNGIAEGVYSAVVAAMNDAPRGGEQAVNVYLDGKQIYSSVKRTEARQGVNLMGNQLGYVY